MNSLTSHLQHEFARLSRPHWQCRPETPLVSAELAGMLGYAPRADVLLERLDGSKRLWIEFEVSRADPVANHAKFATAHLFSPQLHTDSFVSMVSPHVARGRRNLAANTVRLMRRIGMSAFQTVLFPHCSALEVQRLNHLSADLLLREHLDIGPEFERALLVSEPVLSADTYRLHFAGDLSEVMMNLRQWNEEIGLEEKAALWGRRTVTYFVHDPRTRSFAPSKFCAYVPIPLLKNSSASAEGKAGLMNIASYVKLDQGTKIFDGTRARTHLARHLGMIECTPAERPEIAAAFESWLRRHLRSVAVSTAGPTFLVPPPWFV